MSTFFIISLFLVIFLTRNNAVTTNTLNGKVMFGYQCWHGAANDGSGGGFTHWSRSGVPGPGNLVFDAWPNLSEYPASCLYPTNLKYSSGAGAKLYSCYCPGVVDLHFKWMRDYSLDGVFLQRFVVAIQNPTGTGRAVRDKVTTFVKESAEKYGRVWAMMYDVSGANATTLFNVLKSDWNHLVNDLKITTSSQYLKHNGKPVLAIWGFGFTGNHPPDTVAKTLEIINYFKNVANVYLVGGVPFFWREGTGDSRPNFLSAYEAFHTVSPWAVGRYSDTTGYDNLYNNVIVKDKAHAQSKNIGYAPVLFPGFTWANLQSNPGLFNQIPRKGGAFFNHQASKMLTLKPNWVYLAMFDEVDEGTAFYKIASLKTDTPSNAQFSYLSVDGGTVPTDAFLKLASTFTANFHAAVPA